MAHFRYRCGSRSDSHITVGVDVLLGCDIGVATEVVIGSNVVVEPDVLVDFNVVVEPDVGRFRSGVT